MLAVFPRYMMPPLPEAVLLESPTLYSARDELLESRAADPALPSTDLNPVMELSACSGTEFQTVQLRLVNTGHSSTARNPQI